MKSGPAQDFEKADRGFWKSHCTFRRFFDVEGMKSLEGGTPLNFRVGFKHFQANGLPQTTPP